MKIRLALTFAFVLSASPALAQAPSVFVPFTVQQTDAERLQQFMNDNTPPRYSAPILQWLSSMEQNAQAEARAAAAKKVAAAKPVVPPAKVPMVKK